jgi:hemolysin activation/secretion protein
LKSLLKKSGACALILALQLGLAIAQDSPRFDIRSYVVEGNTLIAQPEVEAMLKPYTGTQRDFGDIQRALEALQRAYRERGYSAVRVLIPEQDIRAGQVRLRVIEAKVRKIRTESKHFNESNLRASVPSLKEGTTPRTRGIGRDIQLANENPAKQTSVALESAGEAGQIDAVIRARDYDPQRFSLSLDNTGNPQTGNLRLGVGYQHANVANRDIVFTGQYITSPDNISDVSIYGAGLRVPFYEQHGMLDVFAGYSDVDSGTLQGLFNVSGKGSVFGGRYTYMLPRLEGYEHRVLVGLDYRDYQQNVALTGTTGSLLPDYVVKPWSIGYAGKFLRPEGDIGFYASFSQNISGGNDGSQTTFCAVRSDGSGNCAPARYHLFRYGASAQQLFSNDLLLRAVYNGQYTNDALVPGEQFGMGGWNSVRGFYEREVANDVGNQASVELYSPDVGKWIGEQWRARGLVFLDWGFGRDNSPAALQKNGISSTGVGVRVTRGRNLSLRLDYGYVLNGAEPGGRPSGSDRIHAGMVLSF